MNLFLLSSFIIVATSIFLSHRKVLSAYVKKLLLPTMAILFIAALIIYPKTAVNAASKGIKIWFEIVFPSLFPFFVASQLLSRSGIVSLFGIILEPIMRPIFNVPGCGSFAFAMGIISGYPVGASITADLRKQDLITQIEGERLLTFTNNSGILFIMGAVSVGIFNQPKLGYLLYLSHVAACITVGILFRFYKISKTNLKNKTKNSILSNINIELKKIRNSDINLWTLFGDSIKSSIYTILAIGGFIIFFSVLINILLTSGILTYISRLVTVFTGAGTDIIQGILSGIFEITIGTSLIYQSSVPLSVKLCCTSLIIGWAGLSVHAQVMSIISSTDIRVKPYLTGKALQGIISSIYTLVGYSLFSKVLLKESAVFSNNSIYFSVQQWGDIFKSSLQYVGLSALIMILISVIYLCITGIILKKKLF